MATYKTFTLEDDTEILQVFINQKGNISLKVQWKNDPEDQMTTRVITFGKEDAEELVKEIQSLIPDINEEESEDK